MRHLPLRPQLRTRTLVSSGIGGGDIHSMHPENFLVTTKMQMLSSSGCVFTSKHSDYLDSAEYLANEI